MLSLHNCSGFARDIANHMQYSASQPSVLEPLTQPGVFSRYALSWKINSSRNEME